MVLTGAVMEPMLRRFRGAADEMMRVSVLINLVQPAESRATAKLRFQFLHLM
jgi:hypothetical protein